MKPRPARTRMPDGPFHSHAWAARAGRHVRRCRTCREGMLTLRALREVVRSSIRSSLWRRPSPEILRLILESGERQGKSATPRKSSPFQGARFGPPEPKEKRGARPRTRGPSDVPPARSPSGAGAA